MSQNGNWVLPGLLFFQTAPEMVKPFVAPRGLGSKMDQILGMQPLRNKPDLPAGALPSARPNRRWSVRQKIHTPAYISVDPCEDGTIFGLNEVFDIGTEGLSFQSSKPLSPGSRVRLNLELSGAGEPVRTTGRVIWSEPSGRTGIQLRRSSLSAPHVLDEYLFLNAITACTHYEALQSGAGPSNLPNQLFADRGLARNSADEPADAGFPDYPALLTWLAEIRGEVDAAGLTGNPPLQTLAEQVLRFLHASGVAIATSSEGEMICSASAGAAPGVGTRFQSGAAFSGECIRSGVLMRCDDAETDPRVDHGACLAMGIRSIIAAPIRSDARVTGLIEVFSQQPQAFNRNARILLQRLTEIVAAAQTDAFGISTDPDPVPPSGAEAHNAPLFEMSSDEPEQDDSNAIVLSAAREAPDEFFSSRLQRILVLGTAAALLVAATLLMPWIRTKAGNTQQPGNELQPASFHSADLKTSVAAVPVSELERLRQLAEAGDATAQFALGARYATGEEVVQDYASAARWFSLAADQGHVVAQATLGAYYWAGRGVPEDLHKAYFWSVLAQAGGDEGSKLRLASLASSMSRREVTLAQEEANEWIRQHQLANRAAADPRP